MHIYPHYSEKTQKMLVSDSAVVKPMPRLFSSSILAS